LEGGTLLVYYTARQIIRGSGIKEDNYTWELLMQQFPESVV
jgi:hypothetical protein